MLKAKKINIADTNLANFGTELEKSVKRAAALSENQWNNAGTEPGIQIWRIEKFKVVPWPKKQYGQFHIGDSYIVLHTQKKKNSDALVWDVYFWLGDETTQDEAGTAGIIFLNCILYVFKIYLCYFLKNYIIILVLFASFLVVFFVIFYFFHFF